MDLSDSMAPALMVMPTIPGGPLPGPVVSDPIGEEEVFLIDHEWTGLTAGHPRDLASLISLAGMFVRVSANCKELAGYHNGQLVGRNITNFIHIDELPTFYDQLNLVVNAHKTCAITHRFKSGANYLNYQSTLTPVFTKPMSEPRCLMMLSSRLPDHTLAAHEAHPSHSSSFNLLAGQFTSGLSMDGVRVGEEGELC